VETQFAELCRAGVSLEKQSRNHRSEKPFNKP
jgi:hypothetical protein